MTKRVPTVILGELGRDLRRVRDALELHRGNVQFVVYCLPEYEPRPDGSRAELSPEVVILEVAANASPIELASRCAGAKLRYPDAVVVVLAPAATGDLAVEMLAAGADDLIAQPYADLRGLAQQIASILCVARLKRGISFAPPPEATRRSVRSEDQVVGTTLQRIALTVPRIIESAVRTVHVFGESGTGKEVVARLFQHALPPEKPFVNVNCAAIPASLMAAELFGHAKGAFTGAVAERKGYFEAATNGWIFLDEVATLTRTAQAALLRVIENQEVMRVGEATTRKIRVRVLSASNEDIRKLVRRGKFRQDLWQRLSEHEINLPAIRERREEIAALVNHFCADMPGGPFQISESAKAILVHAPWNEGNVRELRNCLRAMTVFHINKVLTPLSIPRKILVRLHARHLEPSTAPPPGRKAGRGYLPQELGTDESFSFEEFTAWALLTIARARAFQSRGPLSLRELSSATGIPKSTLSVRLKALVSKQLISEGELRTLVNVKANAPKDTLRFPRPEQAEDLSASRGTRGAASVVRIDPAR